jgi:hypothetical protein
MKVCLASVAVAFAVLHVLSALSLWVYGKLHRGAPASAGTAHRISKRLAFIVSLSVAYNCLWSLGFQDASTRVLAQSLLGCALYGAFAAKVTIVRSREFPSLALAVAGAIMSAVFIGGWLTSPYWSTRNHGWPEI